MVGALSAGQLAETLGRRKCISIVSMVFVIGTLVCCIAGRSVRLKSVRFGAIDCCLDRFSCRAVCLHSLTTLLIGRVLIGFPIGALSAVLPMYATEIAPKQIRGLLVRPAMQCATEMVERLDFPCHLLSCCLFGCRERYSSWQSCSGFYWVREHHARHHLLLYAFSRKLCGGPSATIVAIPVEGMKNGWIFALGIAAIPAGALSIGIWFVCAACSPSRIDLSRCTTGSL